MTHTSIMQNSNAFGVGPWKQKFKLTCGFLVALSFLSTGASILGSKHGAWAFAWLSLSSCILALLLELWWPYLVPFGGVLLLFLFSSETNLYPVWLTHILN